MTEEETPIQELRGQTDDPRYRIITKGPRKGMRVRKSKTELRRENLKRMAMEEAQFQHQLQAQLSSKEKPKATKSRDFTGLWVFLVLSALSCFWILVSYFLIELGVAWMIVPLLVVDICADRLYKRPNRPQKYVPLLWMLR